MTITIQPGARNGSVQIPISKSCAHRMLIADYLAGGDRYKTFSDAGADMQATCRCLAALSSDDAILDCGESGSTLRFMLPVAALFPRKITFTASGRLPQRPIAPFLELLSAHGVVVQKADFPLQIKGVLQAGEYAVRGDISSQIITGLLFALPTLNGDSAIRYTTPLQSSGYVDLTLQVLEKHGVKTEKQDDGIKIFGRQKYTLQNDFSPELDWSGAAFWIAMNELGSKIAIPPMDMSSAQPDRAIVGILKNNPDVIYVSQCPDIFPVLSVVAAAREKTTRFVGVRRLRLKESDRLAAMEEVLRRLGVKTTQGEDEFVVEGIGKPLKGNVTIPTFNDHRIAMSAAVAATVADAPIAIESPECTAKSYPDFFKQFEKLKKQ